MMEKIAERKNLIQVIKFGAIGIMNTAIDYLLFAFFFSMCNIDKNIAQVFSTAIAMTNSYILNRYFTFGKKGSVKLNEMWKFIIVNLVSMGVTIILLNLFYDILHAEKLANYVFDAISVPFELAGDMAVLFCKLLATPFSLAVNFIGNRLWVFGEKKH
ncbi:MAG: GtrA family protein [Ruminococcaceae bacterium]|nr:GtrA family protein [Oscillospiraceae bacterium]